MIRRIVLLLVLSMPIMAEYIPGPIEEIPWQPGSFFKFSGAIKHTIFWDSHQIVGSRDNDDLAFPADSDLSGGFDFIDIETFGSIKTKPTQIIDSPSSPLISGEIDVNFSGVTDSTINTVRLFGGFMDLVWQDKDKKDRCKIRMGQYIAPSYVIDASPTTVAYSAGGPFEPFLVSPQLSVEFYNHDLSIMLCAMSEINEYASVGGDPLVPIISSVFLRNAKIPILYAQLRQKIGKHVAIGALQFRVIKPRLESDLGFKVHELVRSIMAFGLFQLNQKPVTAIVKLIYAENCAAEGLLGVYGIRTINPLTDQRTYTPVRSINCWLDIHRLDEDGVSVNTPELMSKQASPWWDPGLFFGFGKNLGSTDRLVNAADFPQFGFSSYQDVVYGGYPQKADIYIDWLVRVAPRFIVHFKNFWIGAEAEYMRAMYGDVNCYAKVVNTHPRDNFRFTAAWYYFF